MSGTKRNAYSIGDTNFDAMMTTLDLERRGKCSLTLTEMATTTVPKIAAGSWIEVAGAVYEFTADETLSGSPSDGIVYVYIVPGATTCAAVMTNTAPTWSDAKQGWYGTAGAATYRYLEYYMTKATAAYKKARGGVINTRFINLISASGMIAAMSGDLTLTADNDVYAEISGVTITIKNSGLYLITGNYNGAAGTSFASSVGKLVVSGSDSFAGYKQFYCSNKFGTSSPGNTNMAFAGFLFLSAGDTLVMNIASSGSSGGQSGYINMQEIK